MNKWMKPWILIFQTPCSIHSWCPGLCQTPNVIFTLFLSESTCLLLDYFFIFLFLCFIFSVLLSLLSLSLSQPSPALTLSSQTCSLKLYYKAPHFKLNTCENNLSSLPREFNKCRVSNNTLWSQRWEILC